MSKSGTATGLLADIRRVPSPTVLPDENAYIRVPAASSVNSTPNVVCTFSFMIRYPQVGREAQATRACGLVLSVQWRQPS